MRIKLNRTVLVLVETKFASSLWTPTEWGVLTAAGVPADWLRFVC